MQIERNGNTEQQSRRKVQCIESHTGTGMKKDRKRIANGQQKAACGDTVAVPAVCMAR